MREVKNETIGVGNVSFQNSQPRKEDVKPEATVETRETTDLGKMPAEVIGRSQVTNSDKDIALLLKRPDAVQKFNYLCDRLVEQGKTYEEACAIVCAAADEFIPH